MQVFSNAVAFKKRRKLAIASLAIFVILTKYARAQTQEQIILYQMFYMGKVVVLEESVR